MIARQTTLHALTSTLKFIGRWAGPVLVLFGIARWAAAIPYPLPTRAILSGVLVEGIAWLLIRSPRRGGNRVIVATVFIGGLSICVWQYIDKSLAYREITVSFDNRDARLVGTLYLPNREGKVPGIVLVHGSGTATRWHYGVFAADHFARQGYAVLAYDKRGVGDSSGKYEESCSLCPANIDLLASDASAALSLLAARPEVRADHVGFWGLSQAGWIVPPAARLNGHAAFMLLVSSPTTTTYQQVRYRLFTGSRDPGRGLTPDQAYAIAARSQVTFNFPDLDPLHYLRELNIPGFWLFGDRDWIVPADKSIANLIELEQAGKPYEYRLIAGAAHFWPARSPTPYSRTLNKLYWRTMDEWLSQTLRGPP